MKHKLSDIINGALNPKYWLMNEPYNEDWDKVLNDLLDKHNFTEIDTYHATLGDARLWITNHPYASFVYMSDTVCVRPSKATLSKAYRKLMNQLGTSVDKYTIKKGLGLWEK